MTDTEPRDRTREALLDVADGLLRDGGADAVTTRAVAAAAGVQPPAIYRLFRDKSGLLDAIAARAFADYVARKQPANDPADPVAALRAGWFTHVEFGLAQPAAYQLMSAGSRRTTTAATAGIEVLRLRIRRVAAAGRLRVSEKLALHLIDAIGNGTVLTAISLARGEDVDELVGAAWDTLAAAILTEPPTHRHDPLSQALVTVRATADGLPGLSPSERTLLVEWLDRAGSAAGLDDAP